MNAIPQLKKIIIFLFTTLTGAVLGVACLLICQMTIHQLKQANSTLFSSYFSTLVSQIQNRGSINIIDLCQLENKNNVLIQLYDNGTAVSSDLAENIPYRQELIELAEHNFYFANKFSNSQGTFWVESQNAGNWLGEYQVVFSTTGNWYGILLLQSDTALQQTIFKTIILYSGIFFFACLIFY